MADFSVHPSRFVCPNQNDVYKCCSQRPPVDFIGQASVQGPLQGYSQYRPGTSNYNVQMTKVWMGRPCFAPDGYQCTCGTYVLRN